MTSRACTFGLHAIVPSKYTYEERLSYSPDAIGEYELDERKTPHEGTLDSLYNSDFEKFIEYNRQDVLLLNKLDKKLRSLIWQMYLHMKILY